MNSIIRLKINIGPQLLKKFPACQDSGLVSTVALKLSPIRMGKYRPVTPTPMSRSGYPPELGNGVDCGELWSKTNLLKLQDKDFFFLLAKFKIYIYIFFLRFLKQSDLFRLFQILDFLTSLTFLLILEF